MSPDEVGLSRGASHRRTPGLRRDEVALLAGVSRDYYTRLEQGRDRCPSDQVLNALARVFQLDADATEHLYQLAHPRARSWGIDGGKDKVKPQVLRLMDSWGHGPASVVNRRTDVLAHNSLFAALAERLGRTDNFMRMLFLSPEARRVWPDWEQEAGSMVAHLRAAVGADNKDPSVLELVEELSESSEDFRQMWARHDVRARRHNVYRLHHPLVGDLIFWDESFSIDSAPGQRVFLSQAEPGPSEEALAKLSAMRPRVDQSCETSSR
ncbi:transcriptional regulator [Planotetraspora mira]|uniref:Transcriptional regulator n=2 Tax=Planotetraspora mira TaxID=58121 RepID=A0A8J3X429_9ACTN|nr:transcriptional regulator [Planotetraspora mira]